MKEEIQMKAPKIAPIVLGTTLILGMSFAQSDSAMATRQNPSRTEMTGLIADSVCKGRDVFKGRTRSRCARECAGRAGEGYVLVAGRTIYALRGHKAELEKFAGDHATVTGEVTGNTIAVESVSK